MVQLVRMGIQQRKDRLQLRWRIARDIDQRGVVAEYR